MLTMILVEVLSDFIGDDSLFSVLLKGLDDQLYATDWLAL